MYAEGGNGLKQDIYAAIMYYNEYKDGEHAEIVNENLQILCKIKSASVRRNHGLFDRNLNSDHTKNSPEDDGTSNIKNPKP